MKLAVEDMGPPEVFHANITALKLKLDGYFEVAGKDARRPGSVLLLTQLSSQPDSDGSDNDSVTSKRGEGSTQPSASVRRQPSESRATGTGEVETDSPPPKKDSKGKGREKSSDLTSEKAHDSTAVPTRDYLPRGAKEKHNSSNKGVPTTSADPPPTLALTRKKNKKKTPKFIGGATALEKRKVGYTRQESENESSCASDDDDDHSSDGHRFEEIITEDVEHAKKTVVLQLVDLSSTKPYILHHLLDSSISKKRKADLLQQGLDGEEPNKRFKEEPTLEIQGGSGKPEGVPRVNVRVLTNYCQCVFNTLKPSCTSLSSQGDSLQTQKMITRNFPSPSTSQSHWSLRHWRWSGAPSSFKHGTMIVW